MDSSDLFSGPAARSGGEPLAARMRPRVLDEFIGQDAIVGPGRLLRRAIQADQLSSLIFYGPPGSGKTTLARVIAGTTKGKFITLNAVLSGIADIRKAVEEAKGEKQYYGRRSILFVDEVHRWNKAQQDALLPWVENGTVILIGATTENPYFEVNKALVSRSRVFRLEALTRENLLETARRALADRDRGYGRWRVGFEPGALEHLVDSASGDARSLLNALELAVETTPPSWPPPEGTEIRIGLREAEESIQRSVVLYDRDGDYHYDVISAFIKSIRGSDPDAALYWLARMVAAGESPDFIFRRLLISAAEDVGLADPGAVAVVEACASAFDRIGFPEGNFHLAEATLYLATRPKSNSALGFFDALEEVKRENLEVPDHLKDSSRDAEGLGHGRDYLYPHAYRDHWVAQAYLPLALEGKAFYHPSSSGAEAAAAAGVERRRELQLAAYLEAARRAPGPGPESAELQWLRRTAERSGEAAIAERDGAFAALALRRHERVLVLNAGDGLLLWEALRRADEGFVMGACWSAEEAGLLSDYAAKAGLPFAPSIVAADQRDPAPALLSAAAEAGLPAEGPFEAAVGRGLFPNPVSRNAILDALPRLLGKGGRFSCAEVLPGGGSRLSDLLALSESSLAERLRAAEEGFYRLQLTGSAEVDPIEALRGACESRGFAGMSFEEGEAASDRFLSPQETEAWLSASSAYGRMLREALGGEADRAIAAFRALVGQGREFPWRRKRIVVSFVRG